MANVETYQVFSRSVRGGASYTRPRRVVIAGPLKFVRGQRIGTIGTIQSVIYTRYMS